MGSFVKNNIFNSAVLLGLFVAIGTGVVVFIFDQTREQIAESEKQYLLGQLHAIIKPDEHDNDIYTDTTGISNSSILKNPGPVIVYRARKSGKPVAALFTTYAPDGYNGMIRILVGIYENGSLAGVRIISHQETPGLGDDIDEAKSDWIHSFTGKSLDKPDKPGWKVKKDGGQFDQFTGATITPRAVIKAIHNSLLYFKANKALLFQ